jgi:hypothetical protein
MTPRMVIKVQRPLESSPGDHWIVCDELRRLNALMPPSKLPTHVREVVDAAARAYFYAVQEDGRLVVGQRFIGHPGWD